MKRKKISDDDIAEMLTIQYFKTEKKGKYN